MKEPKASCPYFDSAIQEIEEARSINDELRKWGNYWYEKYDELDRATDKAIEELKTQIKELEYVIDGMNQNET